MKTKFKTFVATVQIAIVADDDAKAQDALSEALNQLITYREIMDWEYPQGEDSFPKLAGEIDIMKYEEGQVFRMNPETQI